MRPLFMLAIASLLLSACQPQALSHITVLDGEQVYTLATDERIPAELLTGSGIMLGPADQLLVNGQPFPNGQTLPVGMDTLQVRHALPLTLVTTAGEQSLLTAARVVGGALQEAGIQLYTADFIDPPADTPLSAGMRITYRPAQELTVTSSAGVQVIRSSAGTVGAALAGAGIPLTGLDYSLPVESEALPADGQVRVVQVSESVQLVQKLIPFETETVPSPEVELGQQEITQPGQEGLAIARTRIRYEDGQEVSRTVEDESVVRLPVTRIVNTGTDIVMKTETVGGETIEYWLAYQMYATIYSPCNSGTGGCSYSTASGLRAGRGVVAMDRSMYSYLQGARVYIPGYGYAVVGDVGGGYLIEELIGVSRYRWIDLGFNDNNIVDMSGWHTVYFLAPAPASIPPVMQ
jgi:resuscitation-promoting factor RpfB